MKTFSANKTILSYVAFGTVVVACAGVGLVVGRRTGKQDSQVPRSTVSQTTGTVPKYPIVKVNGEPANRTKPKDTTRPDKAEDATPQADKTSISESKDVFGKSVKGTPLVAYILGDGSNVTIIFGAFHGNEQSTDGVVYSLRDYLKDNPQLLDGKKVVLVPIVNPDGLKRDSRVNAHGVDINRNFPGTWKKQAAKARYNPGSQAASEPETRAVISLMNKYNPTKVISIHEPFHTMNYTGAPGKELAQLMRKFNHYPITPDIGYPTPGSFGDYCGKKLGIAIVTLEMPNESAAAGWVSNKQAFLAAIAH